MSTQPSRIHALAGQRADADPSRASTVEDHIGPVARDVHATAGTALERIESLVVELENTIHNLTDPEALAGQGNLENFRNRANAEVAAIRESLEMFKGQHADLRVFLAAAGVPFRPIPG